MAPARRDARRGRARSSRRGRERRPRVSFRLPYTRRNVLFFASGIGVILIGYVFLAIPPVDGFFSLSLAPILLVLGYCVLIPIGLLLGEPEDTARGKAGDEVGG